jgi:dienelactone hydrolase
MRHILVFLLVLVAAKSVAAQDKNHPLPGDEMIYKYLCAETDKLSRTFMDGAKTIDEWKEKLPRLKREYMDMLGLWPIPEKTPLKATVTGQIEAHGVIVEKLHYQSKPGLYVTANLYRPKESGVRGQESGVKKLPAILYVCGHSGRGRDGNKVAFQDHGFWFANNGYVCLVVDTLQLGEIPGVHHGTYGRPWNHIKSYGLTPPSPPQPFTPSPLLPSGADNQPTRFWWHSAGYTPAGVECWNGIRGIDYLLTRPEVDPERIGVTGISGGGAATFWIAAADERVKVAVPVSGMSDLESYVKNKVVNGHCDCMFLYNNYQWEWTTIAALIAPRPMLFANSDNDPIFPMDGNRRIIKRLRKLYAMYPAQAASGGRQPPEHQPREKGTTSDGSSTGLRPPLASAEHLVEEYVSKGGHAYRPDLRVAIFKFINKHLKGDTTTPVEDSEKYKDLPGKDLRVFATDADIPNDAINARIDETFVARAKVELPKPETFTTWRKEILRQLNQRVFRSPAGQARSVVFCDSTSLGGTNEKFAFYFDENTLDSIDQHTFATQFTKGSYVFIAPNYGDFLGFTLLRRGRDRDTPQLIETGQYLNSRFDTRWARKSPPNYVERSQALVGHTLDELKMWHFISNLNLLDDGRIEPFKLRPGWTVVGKGHTGILAAYAALFEPSIKEVIVIDPPKSHKEGPHFLGVLNVIDIPEALGLLAPTPLTIVGGDDAAFECTAEIYRRAGAANKLKRVKK